MINFLSSLSSEVSTSIEIDCLRVSLVSDDVDAFEAKSVSFKVLFTIKGSANFKSGGIESNFDKKKVELGAGVNLNLSSSDGHSCSLSYKVESRETGWLDGLLPRDVWKCWLNFDVGAWLSKVSMHCWVTCSIICCFFLILLSLMNSIVAFVQSI